jgi:hypothetical protein
MIPPFSAAIITGTSQEFIKFSTSRFFFVRGHFLCFLSLLLISRFFGCLVWGAKVSLIWVKLGLAVKVRQWAS